MSTGCSRSARASTPAAVRPGSDASGSSSTSTCDELRLVPQEYIDAGDRSGHQPPPPRARQGKRRRDGPGALPPGRSTFRDGRMVRIEYFAEWSEALAAAGLRSSRPLRTAPARNAGRCGVLRGNRVIGLPRFELGTSPTRTERATRLRHSPTGPSLALPYSSCVSARARRVAAAAAVFLVVAGCTSGDDESDSASAEATSPASGDAASTGPPPRPPGRPRPRCASCAWAASTSRPTSRLRAATGAGSWWSAPGRIRVVSGGRVLGTPFLDISDLVTTGGRERAPLDGVRARLRPLRALLRLLHGLGRLHPDRPVPARRRQAQTVPTAARARLVMRVPHHRFNHKGGQLQFGPDGKLYAGFGDGGGGGDPDRNGQNLSRQLAKLIRISPRAGGGYSVPKDNPFRGRSGALPNIYAYGLRNPYRFSFDRLHRQPRRSATWARTRSRRSTSSRTGADAGVRRAAATTSAGASSRGSAATGEGSAPGARPPAITHQHSDGYCSITGGYVIRDRAMGAASTASTCTATTASPTCAVASLRARNAPSRALSAQVSEPGLVRRGRPRPCLRDLARRPRVPAGRALKSAARRRPARPRPATRARAAPRRPPSPSAEGRSRR